MTSELIAKLETLAPQQQQQVLDFVEFLANKYTCYQEAPQQRVPDLNKGQIWLSDDFNDPLPDEFWLSKGIIYKYHECLQPNFIGVLQYVDKYTKVYIQKELR